MNNNDSKAVQELLASPKEVVIVTHKNPDGDAVGSSLALYHYLKQYGHRVCVITPNDFPEFLKWMPAAETILKFDMQTEQALQKIEAAQVIFTLDFNSLSRADDMKPHLEASEAIFIMIDHHQQPEAYATYTYSDPAMGSTCEMIYNFIGFLGDTDTIHADMASCIYTGIMTDSGSFRFPGTTGTTHRIVADLIDKGARNSDIHSAVYDVNTPGKLQLLGCALNNLFVLETLHTSYIALSAEELKKHRYKKGDTEGFVNYGLSLKGVKLTAFFMQNPGENYIRISLRSVGDIPVNEMAKEHFNGGGHSNAAGGRSDLSLQDTIEKFKHIAGQYKALLT